MRYLLIAALAACSTLWAENSYEQAANQAADRCAGVLAYYRASNGNGSTYRSGLLDVEAQRIVAKNLIAWDNAHTIDVAPSVYAMWATATEPATRMYRDYGQYNALKYYGVATGVSPISGLQIWAVVASATSQRDAIEIHPAQEDVADTIYTAPITVRVRKDGRYYFRTSAVFEDAYDGRFAIDPRVSRGRARVRVAHGVVFVRGRVRPANTTRFARLTEKCQLWTFTPYESYVVRKVILNWR